jgi:predicted nucleic acid-binding protein
MSIYKPSWFLKLGRSKQFVYRHWQAAHARAEGWILVTNNEREFIRVNGLQVENWVEADRQ